MRHISLPDTGTAAAWRDAARAFLKEWLAPADILWGSEASEHSLFDDQPVSGAAPVKMTVPRSFVSLAETVCWHRDADRFARLYAFLWRLKDAPYLIADRGDRELAHLRSMEKSVHRCQHKMKAFVRFREIGDREDARRSFAAWFEPTHHTVEPTADFFARRFADMDWRIVTPEKTAIFQDGRLSFAPGQPKPDLPDDAGEALWLTYFRSIFNPARLKVQAMTSEMPKKYWKNLPEAATIPDLIANAPVRARAMAEAAPTLPPVRADKARQQLAAHIPAWEGPKEALPASSPVIRRIWQACRLSDRQGSCSTRSRNRQVWTGRWLSSPMRSSTSSSPRAASGGCISVPIPARSSIAAGGLMPNVPWCSRS